MPAAEPIGAGALARGVGTAVALTLLWLVVFDVIGVAAAFVLDVLPVRGRSAGVAYAIWLVAGVFCGVISYGSAAGAGARARALGLPVLLTIVGVIAALLVACAGLRWGAGEIDEGFVPDNPALTLVFGIAAIGGAGLMHHALQPNPPRHDGASSRQRRQ